LIDYDICRREVKYGKNSRIDLLLENSRSEKCYVEVKNTTLLHEGNVAFPDAITERGLKHLEELTDVVKEGHRAVMFYLVNRPDGEKFEIAEKIDPAYAEGFLKARKAGVEVLAYRSAANLSEIKLGARLPF
jgi:sugar fermentation stimulation protein A